MIRYGYIALGCVFLVLGTIGAFVPLMPSTPWVLLASYFFSRSSPRLHAWLRRTPYYGQILRDWDAHRGMRLPIKITAICGVVTVITLTVLFAKAPDWGKACAVGLAAIGICVILFVVKTVPASPPMQPPPMDSGGERV